MAADDFSFDLEDRDLVFDRAEDSGLDLDLEDRDLVLDPTDGDLAVEFRAVGAPGPSTYQLWLAAGNVGTIDDFLAAGGGISAALLDARLATKANSANATLTGTAQAEDLVVAGEASINRFTDSTLDGGFF